MSKSLHELLKSNLLLQFILVSLVFAFVLLGTYPAVQEAQRQEQFNHYPDKLLMEENLARRRFLLAQSHPEKIDEYIAAGDQLASVSIRQQKFDEAVDIYSKQLSTTWRLVSNAYNPRYNDANLKLAGVFRDKSDYKTALVCYKSVLDLDRKYLPAGDPKIERDLNNIGLAHYLRALSLEQDKDRQPEFQLAIDNLKQALALLDQHPEAKTARAAALSNLYLAERDIGNKKYALECRKEARAIDRSMQRVCREP